MRLNHASVGLHLNLLADLAEFQCHVGLRVAVALQHEPCLEVPCESFLGHVQAITARRQIRQSILAIRAGYRFAKDAGLDAGESNTRLSDSGSGLVLHYSGNLRYLGGLAPGI